MKDSSERESYKKKAKTKQSDTIFLPLSNQILKFEADRKYSCHLTLEIQW